MAPYSKTHFNDLRVLNEMLALRRAGWSYPRLAARYGNVDHTTIVYHVQKATRDLPPEMRRLYIRVEQHVRRPATPPVLLVLPTDPPARPEPSDRYAHLIDDECVNVNPGKSYREYRREGKKRRKEATQTFKSRLLREFDERVARRGKIDIRTQRRVPPPLRTNF